MTKEVKDTELKVEAQSESVVVKKQPLIKRRRILGTSSGKLKVNGQDPSFHYRWVESDNPDKPNRMRDIDEAGYTPVLEGEVDHIDAKVYETAIGKTIQTKTGNRTMILMKKPKEWFDEDSAIKEKEREDSLKAKGLEPHTKLKIENLSSNFNQ